LKNVFIPQKWVNCSQCKNLARWQMMPYWLKDFLFNTTQI